MNKETGPLDFRAINPGLGFHPFSDGLPYAPVSKAPGKAEPAAAPRRTLSTSGTGAVAAGPAKFAIPGRPGSPRVSVPVASELSKPAMKTTTATVAPTVDQELKDLSLEPTYGFLYVLKRILAYTLDSALNISLCATGLSLALVKQDISPDLLMNSGVILISSLFLIVFNWALITAQEIAFGTTIGKRIFGLAIKGSISAIFLRSFFFLPSLGFAGLGLLWGVVDRKRRCWHDMAVNVQPVEIARL